MQMEYRKQKQKKLKRGLRMNTFLERFDSFGQALPVFNIKGTEKVSTLTGGISTVLIAVILLTYSSLKLLQLVSKENPNVSEVNELDYYNFEEVLSLQDIDFKIAFSVEGYLSREIKDNPKYVKYIVRQFGKENGYPYERILPYHKCTLEDWKALPMPDKGSFDALAEIKDNPKRGMYCLDLDQEVNLYGNERNANYASLEIILAPCNYVHSHLGYEEDSVHPECIADLNK